MQGFKPRKSTCRGKAESADPVTTNPPAEPQSSPRVFVDRHGPLALRSQYATDAARAAYVFDHQGFQRIPQPIRKRRSDAHT